MRHVLVYDDGCGPCTRFREAVGFLDVKRRISYVGLDAADRSGMLDAIPHSRRHRSFHLVGPNGTPTSAVEALPRLIALLPGGRLASEAIDSVPPVASATTFVYSVLSRLHDSGSCSCSPGSTGSPRHLEFRSRNGVLPP